MQMLARPLLQVIKRFIMHSKKTAFIVEHDFIMAAYLADRVVVYDGTPSKNATAHAPQSLLTGAGFSGGTAPYTTAPSYKLLVKFWLYTSARASVRKSGSFYSFDVRADSLGWGTGVMRWRCARTGMNAFLRNLDITFRRDPTNYRPRINKHESHKDHEQKLAGTYYVRCKSPPPLPARAA